MKEIRDSNGTLIEDMDIIECPEVSLDNACRYHVAYIEDFYKSDEIVIRDLGNNNVYMYDQNGPYYVIGKFWDHLDKLNDDDIKYHFARIKCMEVMKEALLKR